MLISLRATTAARAQARAGGIVNRGAVHADITPCAGDGCERCEEARRQTVGIARGQAVTIGGAAKPEITE